MEKKLCIIGAGGHSRSVISLLRDQNFEIIGIYDDSYKDGIDEFIYSVELIGKISDYNDEFKIILSVGDNKKRQKLFDQFHENIYQGNVSHSRSFIETTAILGKANLIFGNTFINSNVKIGNNNIINTGSIIEHEAIIGSHNHISVGSIICGRVVIGNNCFLGAGSVINDYISICDNVVIGSNSTVINSITEPGVYVGQPVRRINI